MKIFILNPGSTSLKLAIYEDDRRVDAKTLRFDSETLAQMRTSFSERVRLQDEAIQRWLEESGLSAADFDCAISRGGVLGKVATGAYVINENMVDYVYHSPTNIHSVGVVLAYHMMHPLGKPCFIYDAVTADEWLPMCKLTGIKGLEKPTQQHTLNTRQVARQAAAELGKTIEDSNIIVAHLGGGIDTTFFKNGRIVESMGYNELGFSTDRCGALHYNELLKLVKTTSVEELQALNRGKGGLVSHLGTADVMEVEQRIDQGDEYAALVLHTMSYRVAQCIAAGAVALGGAVDAIVLTGGIAHSRRVTGWITERVSFLGRVMLMPGELETEALASGALRVMLGQEQAKEF